VLNKEQYWYNNQRHHQQSNSRSPSPTTQTQIPIQTRESESITSIFHDTEVLNTDIARAGLYLLQRTQPQDHDDHNSAIFQQRIQLHANYLEECLKIRPPCRYEEFSVFIKHQSSLSSNASVTGSTVGGSDDMQESKIRVILDIAHNEDAIKALVNRTKLIFPHASIR
jgi:hypothetical protein